MIIELVRCFLITLLLSFFITSYNVVIAQPVNSNYTSSSLFLNNGNGSGGGNGGIASTDRVTYDQRQSGKYNINVSIKDFAVIQIDQNDLSNESFDDDDDYYYDDDDLTVSPIQLAPLKNFTTTKKTTTTTIPPIATSPTPNLNQSKLPTNTVAATTPINTINDNQAGNTFSPNLLADLASVIAQQHATKPSATQTITTKTPSINATASISTNEPTTIMPIKSQSVVILENTLPTEMSPTSTHLPMKLIETDIIGRTKDIPIRMIEQAPPRPIFYQNRNRFSRFPGFDAPALGELRNNINDPTKNGDSNIDSDDTLQTDDSKIYKFKMRRTHKIDSGLINYDEFKHPNSYHYQHSSHMQHRTKRCRSNQYRDESGNCRSKRSSSLLKKLFSMLVSLPFVANEGNDA